MSRHGGSNPSTSAMKNKVYTYICKNCGKEFTTKNEKAELCSNQCIAEYRHKESYKDFLENNDKYCRGNYTPKYFKKEFIEEQ